MLRRLAFPCVTAIATLSSVGFGWSESPTHYHADCVSPDWAKHLTLTGRVGRHLFYHDPAA